MERKRNLAPALGLFLGVGALVGYFGLVFLESPGVTRFLRFPFLHLTLAAAALALSFVGIRRAYADPQRYGGRVLAPILGTLTLGVVGLFVFYLFGYSSALPEAAAAPALGNPAPGFELADQRGQTVRLEELRGRNVLLVFYRGFW